MNTKKALTTNSHCFLVTAIFFSELFSSKPKLFLVFVEPAVPLAPDISFGSSIEWGTEEFIFFVRVLRKGPSKISQFSL